MRTKPKIVIISTPASYRAAQKQAGFYDHANYNITLLCVRGEYDCLLYGIDYAKHVYTADALNIMWDAYIMPEVQALIEIADDLGKIIKYIN